jgi:hypothetical protein
MHGTPFNTMTNRRRLIRWLGLLAITLGAIASVPWSPAPNGKECCPSCCVLDLSHCPVSRTIPAERESMPAPPWTDTAGETIPSEE